MGAVARIRAFVEGTPRESEIEKPVDVVGNWPARGHLTFDKVWTADFPGLTGDTWGLRDVSFDIKAGDKVAIYCNNEIRISMLLSIFGLAYVSRGTVMLDGVDMSHVARSVLRSRLHFVSPNGFVHGQTVRQVLDPQGDIPDELINEVLHDCDLLIKILNCGGLFVDVEKLVVSGVEKQVLLLARTILQARDPQDGGLVIYHR